MDDILKLLAANSPALGGLAGAIGLVIKKFGEINQQHESKLERLQALELRLVKMETQQTHLDQTLSEIKSSLNDIRELLLKR